MPKNKMTSSKTNKTGKSMKRKVNKLQYKESIASIFNGYYDNTPMARRISAPIPDGLRTILKNEFTAVEAVMGPASNYFQVHANSAYRPFDITGLAINGTSCSAMPGTGVGEQSGLAAKNSAYITALLGLYDVFHTIGCRIKVYYYPEALSDTLDVSIVPQRLTDGAIQTSTGRADVSSRDKHKLITTSVPKMYVSNYLNVPEFFGVSPKDYVGEYQYGTGSEGAVISRPSTTHACVWTIIRQCLNNTNITASGGLPCKVELEYDVVFKKNKTIAGLV